MLTITPTKLFLIGPSGSGKSTIGPLLAKRFKADFDDIDAMIEEDAGCKITELFSRGGERNFRELERQAISMVLVIGAKRQVIALGGGAFSNRATRELIMNSGVVIYLSCPVRELHRRLRLKSDRPLLNVRPAAGETERQAKLRKIGALLDKRKHSYAKAHIRVSTANKSMTECVQEVYLKVREHNART